MKGGPLNASRRVRNETSLAMGQWVRFLTTHCLKCFIAAEYICLHHLTLLYQFIITHIM